MTDGQEWALAQLQEVAASNQAMEIVSVTRPTDSESRLRAELSIDCSTYSHAEGGLPLRHRERVVITIPADFPLDRPEVRSTHKRFAGFPHVQWGDYLCLYQSPETEWSPADGMFGFLERLDAWLRAGALGQLDPTGLPLHPPAVYAQRSQYVVPRVDAPPVTPPWWIGYAEIEDETVGAVLLGKWHAYDGEIPKIRLASAILLPTDMPFEYPSTFRTLAETLVERAVTVDLLRVVLELTALRAPEGKALYVLLGAAMRGVAGEIDRKQHLACWYISPERAASLRELAGKDQTDAKARASDFDAWAGDTQVEWCRVREDRPEFVVPRDLGSPLAWWRSKRVTILGCGALGSAVALMLARAGIAHLRLYDRAGVAPGVLSRQNFQRHQIGYTKSSATFRNVEAVNPAIEVVDRPINVVHALRTEADKLFDCDVIVNATASVAVAAALEKHLSNETKLHPPIVSMAVGHKCDVGMVTLGIHGVAGVAQDLERRTKIALANASNGQDFLDEFWPLPGQRHKLFQPEPGCSDPTFVGSAADVQGLSAGLLNVASSWLAEPTTSARCCLIRAPHTIRPQRPAIVQFAWPADRVITDHRHGFHIRCTPGAERDLLGWIRSSRRLRGPRVETGGLLFGQFDEFLKIAWVTEVSGPPPDSRASAEGFLCGVAGTKELSEEKRARTRGSVSFIGMWHTHPGSIPSPSCTDFSAMSKLRESPSSAPRHFLMLILGGDMESPQFEGFVFARSDED